MLFVISFVVILLDRITKILVSNVTSITVINNFFNITLVHNTGAAWSILNGYRLFLIAVSIIELFLIYVIFIKNKKLDKINSITLGLLVGGIVGNLIDRLIYGYVIDFLDFNILGYDFPIFNVADIMIVIATFLLILLICRGDKVDRG